MVSVVKLAESRIIWEMDLCAYLGEFLDCINPGGKDPSTVGGTIPQLGSWTVQTENFLCVYD